ncbi:hypothetical protein [Streptomyces puniciscabiei]|uniref:hypothetical protein n=1 Tax=Streptomyces puniciscabiei TaxID=164348 RepID=UPI00379EC17C
MLVATTVFYTGWALLGARGLKPEYSIDSKTLFDLVKLSFGVVAGAGTLVALVVAYRRQRVDEDGALREATRLHTERFTTAVTQLGDPSSAVRLGGVHALAGLADDAPPGPSARRASMSCAPTSACPTPSNPTCRRTTRKPGAPAWPCGKSGTPSSASSATTSALPPRTRTPGRTTTSTSPTSRSMAETSPARCSPAA